MFHPAAQSRTMLAMVLFMSASSDMIFQASYE
jgi:hypothetical protein